MFHQPHEYQVIVEATLEDLDKQTYLQDQASKPDSLTYLVFGHPGEYFVAHWIVAKPDFDQIAAVDLNSSESLLLSAEAPYCFAQVALHADDKPLEGPAGDGASLQIPNGVLQVTSFQEIYLEFDDLSD